LVACGGSPADAPARPGGGPVPVKVLTMASSPVALDVEAWGSMLAERVVELKPESTGAVVTVSFTDGQRVHAGDVLVKLRDGEPKATRAEAEATLALAEADLARATTLRAQQTASQADVDAATARRDLARIGIDRAYTFAAIEPVTAAALQKALDLCVAQGATLVDVSLPPVDHILVQAIIAAFAEAAISHAKSYPSERDRYSDEYADILEIGHNASGIDCATVAIWRREFAGHLAKMFKSIDVMAAPVLPVPPLTLEQMAAISGGSPLDAAGVLKYTIPFNLAGVPTLTMPMGHLEDRTPLGFQLIGPALGERALLSAGAAYEAVAGYATEHPPL